MTQCLHRLLDSMLCVAKTMRDTLNYQPRHQNYDKEQTIWECFVQSAKFCLPVLDQCDGLVEELLEMFVDIVEKYPAQDTTNAKELQ